MTAKRSTWLVYTVLSILLLTMIATGCNGGRTTPSADPTEFFEGQGEARVRREYDVVWAGPGDASILPRLGDGWQDFPSGSRITTDADGEGLVEFLDCLSVYVFQSSQLVQATCPKSDYEAGNVMCMEEGVGTFNNECSGRLIIQTRSADVLLEGTWISVFYLPDTRLTLVLVFDHTSARDAVRVRPVLNFDERTVGDYDTVEEGFFWFTAPEGGPEEVGDLDAREAHPFDRLPELIDTLDLGPWIDRIRGRADRDDVPFPEFPGLGTIVLQGMGGAIENDLIEEAVLSAVPWQRIADANFPDQDLEFLIAFPTWDGDARDLSYDRPMARELLAQSRREDELELILLYATEPGALESMAADIAAGLEEVGIGVELDAMPAAEVSDIMRELLTDGWATLWLGREPAEVDIDLPAPEVDFHVEPLILYSYRDPQCALVTWDVTNSPAVLLDGDRVADAGEAELCPDATTDVVLEVERLDGAIDTYEETIEVVQDDEPPTISSIDVTFRPTVGLSFVTPYPVAGDSVTITAQARDAESGVGRIVIFVEGQLVGRCADTRCSATVENIPAGVLGYRVEAYDRAGNDAVEEDVFSVARGFPDLVVIELEVIGSPSSTAEGDIQVPILVTVENQGDAGAEPFEVAIEYTSTADNFTFSSSPNRRPGENTIWSGVTDGPLPPGESVTFEGLLRFSPNLAGARVTLAALADTCQPRGMPASCRIREADEDNNVSRRVTLTLPTAPGGGVVLIGAGGPLDDVRVQEALLAAAPWAELASALREDGAAGQLTLAFPDVEADADQVGYDPELAYQLLAEAGYPNGFGLVLVFPQGDPALDGVGQWVIDHLAEFGLDAATFGGSPAELEEMLQVAVDSGEPAMLLQRQ